MCGCFIVQAWQHDSPFDKKGAILLRKDSFKQLPSEQFNGLLQRKALVQF